MLNLAVTLENSARERSEHPAIVFQSFRLTYQQINDMANQVANGLRKAGVRKGDKVALTCPNLPYFPIIYYGILKVGAVFVPLNVLLRPREIAYHLSDSEAVAYICFEGPPDLPMAQYGHEGFQDCGTCKNLWIIPMAPMGESPISGVPTFWDLIAEQPITFDTVQCRSDDTCVLIYTSGTTGRPKGAELTHSNILLNCMLAKDLIQGHCSDIALAALPLFHAFGLTCVLTTCMFGGATLVLIARFDPAEVLRIFKEEKISVFAGVPTMYWDILKCPEFDTFDIEGIAKTLRLGISGGSSMAVDVLTQFQDRFDIKILEGYGLSETSPAACFNRVDVQQKVGSIGVPIWGVEMMIVDRDMNEMPVGQPGEIVVRGHNVMKGYYRRDEANDEVFRGGWFHTGDVGYKDEDGYYFIVDRITDTVIRSGFNVYPREVEEVLMTHPDISLAAVIGIPHVEHGEEVKAYVVPQVGSNITPHEIIEWSKSQMAAYKYPREVEIVRTLPMGPTGKILKAELRERLEKA